jgi:glutamine amidotransferase-like uncharacterized protein
LPIRRIFDKKPPKPNINFIKSFLILVPVILLLIFSYAVIQQEYAVKTKEVKVLIYNGPETSPNCVGKMEDILNDSNVQNLTKNVKFTYTTTNMVNRETLNSYDVLIMPGTNIGYDYVNSENVDGDAIKSFVASGNGYVGICAGAYSGALYTDGWYNDWGIAPHVVAEAALSEGNLTVEMTADGEHMLDYRGNLTMPHINGPTMYTSTNGSTVIFARYNNNTTGYQGSEAIVGDFYGNGRTVLSGVHPELEPQNPQMLIKLILWADNMI